MSRGRPRKAGERYPGGQLKRVQKLGPTAQLIAKRVARLLIAGVDPSREPPTLANTGLAGPEHLDYFRLAESWLGVLYAGRAIDHSQFRAGLKYHEIYKGTFPQGWPGSALDDDCPLMNGRPFQSFEPTEIESDLGLAWKASENILATLDKRAYQLIKNICVFNKFERFIDTTSPRNKEAWRSDAQDRTRFVAGLNALAMAYGFKATPQKAGLAPHA